MSRVLAKAGGLAPYISAALHEMLRQRARTNEFLRRSVRVLGTQEENLTLLGPCIAMLKSLLHVRALLCECHRGKS